MSFLQAWVASRVWSTRGRLALRRGDIPRAVAALEQAVSWRPGAFGPLLLLARGYLRARETWRAHRTLAQAREADPARFARVAPGWLAREGVDTETLGHVLGLAPVAPRGAPVDGSKVPSLTHARLAEARAVAPSHLPFGDCQDLDEYARFQAMPPISEAERESVDWDSVLEDLLAD